MKKLPEFETRGTYKKEDFNILLKEVQRLSNITAQFPLEISNVGPGPLLRFVDREFWAVLTACVPSSSCSSSSSPTCPYGPAYCWAEVQTTGGGQFSIGGAGRTSGAVDCTGMPLNPAYEVNGACLVPGTIVRLRPGYSTEFLIDHCCTFVPPFVSSSSSSNSSSSSAGAGSQASSASSAGSSSGSSTASSASSTASSQASSSSGSLCVPFVSMVSCGGSSGGSSAGSGTLVVTLKYLNIPSSLGITVSDTPCGTSSS